MELRPIDTPARLTLVAGWLSDKENYKWLDFGGGRQALSPEWLKIMCQRKTEVLRVFTPDYDDNPIGIVALSDVNRHFKTARIWTMTGDKSFRARGYATRASSAMLTYAFEKLGLHAINTWIVDGNPSLRIAQRLGFKLIGRQRQCHYIDGHPYDRLWLDIVPSEHNTF